MTSSTSGNLTTGDQWPSTAAHTRGEWTMTSSGTLPIYIGVKDGRWKHVPGTLIAEVGNNLSVGTGDFQEDLANARLIAAAPDMLAALKKLLRKYETCARCCGNDDDVIDDSSEFARAAIAKATGAA